MTHPPVPQDLRQRCLETIPAAARTDTRPRLSVGDGSRKRFLWLCGAAAVPVVTVLAVLPVRRYIAAQARSQSQTPPKESVAWQRDPLADKPEPYVRIHAWSRGANETTLTAPSYRVAIYDAKRGYAEWYTNANYKIAPRPGMNPFHVVRIKRGKFYDEYYPLWGKVLVRRDTVAGKYGMNGSTSVREPNFAAKVGHGPGRLESRGTTHWGGRTVNRLTYRSVPIRFRGSSVPPPNLPAWHTEVDVDPETGLILHCATWTVYPQFAAKFPEGVLTGDKTYFYKPRPVEDLPFWDVKRLKAGAR